MKNLKIYSWTTAFLALFAGGSITVLFILVPFWQWQEPQAVLEWFTNFGPRVGMTMLPMEIIPLLLSVYAYYISGDATKWLWATVNISNVIILLTLFIYFLPANFTFVDQTIPLQDVSSELVTWKIVHIVRTILSVASVIFAVMALVKHERSIKVE